MNKSKCDQGFHWLFSFDELHVVLLVSLLFNTIFVTNKIIHSSAGILKPWWFIIAWILRNCHQFLTQVIFQTRTWELTVETNQWIIPKDCLTNSTILYFTLKYCKKGKFSYCWKLQDFMGTVTTIVTVPEADNVSWNPPIIVYSHDIRLTCIYTFTMISTKMIDCRGKDGVLSNFRHCMLLTGATAQWQNRTKYYKACNESVCPQGKQFLRQASVLEYFGMNSFRNQTSSTCYSSSRARFEANSTSA